MGKRQSIVSQTHGEQSGELRRKKTGQEMTKKQRQQEDEDTNEHPICWEEIQMHDGKEDEQEGYLAHFILKSLFICLFYSVL